MGYFSTFFFSKARRNGRSYGQITVRHRGGGYFKKFAKTVQHPFVDVYRIFTFLRYLNFSGFKFPLFILINASNKYMLFTHRFFSNSFSNALELKTFYLLKLSAHLATTASSIFVLDDEFKPFDNAFYFSNFLNISNSAFIRFLSFYPNQKFQYALSNNVYARFVKTRGQFAVTRLPSGTLMRFSKLSSFVCFGYKNLFSENNFSLNNNVLVRSSAGKIRNFGVRPHVRGVAINPVDHPHGGRTGESRPSVSPWAKLTKGYPTVRRSQTLKL